MNTTTELEPSDALNYLDEMNEQGRIEYDDYLHLHNLVSIELDDARREGWSEGDLANYPLVLAVEQFKDNGGDAWGNLDDALERVQSVRNPYKESDKPAPEFLPGTLDALDSLTIRKANTPSHGENR